MRNPEEIRKEIEAKNIELKNATKVKQFTITQQLDKLNKELNDALHSQPTKHKQATSEKIAGLQKSGIGNILGKKGPTTTFDKVNSFAAAPQTAGSVKPAYKDREPEKTLVSEEQLEALKKLINDNTGYEGLISALNAMKDLSADVKARVSAAVNIFKDQKKPYMVAKMVLPQQLPSILSVGSSLAPASERKPILKTSEPTKPGLGVGPIDMAEQVARLKKIKATNVSEQVVSKGAAGNNTSAPAKLNVPNKQDVTNKQNPQTNAPAQIKSQVNTVKPQIKTPSPENASKSAAPAETVAKPILNSAPVTNNNAATPAPASKTKRPSFFRRKANEFASFMKGKTKKKNATTTQTLTTYNGNTASPNGDGKPNKPKQGGKP